MAVLLIYLLEAVQVDETAAEAALVSGAASDLPLELGPGSPVVQAAGQAVLPGRGPEAAERGLVTQAHRRDARIGFDGPYRRVELGGLGHQAHAQGGPGSSRRPDAGAGGIGHR